MCFLGMIVHLAVQMHIPTPMPSSGSLHETSKDRFKVFLRCTSTSTEDSVMHRHHAASPGISKYALTAVPTTSAPSLACKVFLKALVPEAAER